MPSPGITAAALFIDPATAVPVILNANVPLTAISAISSAYSTAVAPQSHLILRMKPMHIAVVVRPIVWLVLFLGRILHTLRCP